MERVQDAVAVLAASFYGREANEAEIMAMTNEMERDSHWIAPHAFGRDGGLFHLEPQSFHAILKQEAADEPR